MIVSMLVLLNIASKRRRLIIIESELIVINVVSGLIGYLLTGQVHFTLVLWEEHQEGVSLQIIGIIYHTSKIDRPDTKLRYKLFICEC